MTTTTLNGADRVPPRAADLDSADSAPVARGGTRVNPLWVVHNIFGGDALDAYLRSRPDRCSECGYRVVTQGHRPGPRHFWGFPPWEESGQEDVCGCSQWKPAKV